MGPQTNLQVNLIGYHKGRFQAISRLSYGGIIRCHSLGSALYSVPVCLLIPFMGGIVGNFTKFRMNEIGATGGSPEATVYVPGLLYLDAPQSIDVLNCGIL